MLSLPTPAAPPGEHSWALRRALTTRSKHWAHTFPSRSLPLPRSAPPSTALPRCTHSWALRRALATRSKYWARVMRHPCFCSTARHTQGGTTAVRGCRSDAAGLGLIGHASHASLPLQAAAAAAATVKATGLTCLRWCRKLYSPRSSSGSAGLMPRKRLMPRRAGAMPSPDVMFSYWLRQDGQARMGRFRQPVDVRSPQATPRSCCEVLNAQRCEATRSALRPGGGQRGGGAHLHHVNLLQGEVLQPGSHRARVIALVVCTQSNGRGRRQGVKQVHLERHNGTQVGETNRGFLRGSPAGRQRMQGSPPHPGHAIGRQAALTQVLQHTLVNLVVVLSVAGRPEAGGKGAAWSEERAEQSGQAVGSPPEYDSLSRPGGYDSGAGVLPVRHAPRPRAQRPLGPMPACWSPPSRSVVLYVVKDHGCANTGGKTDRQQLDRMEGCAGWTRQLGWRQQQGGHALERSGARCAPHGASRSLPLPPSPTHQWPGRWAHAWRRLRSTGEEGTAGLAR